MFGVLARLGSRVFAGNAGRIATAEAHVLSGAAHAAGAEASVASTITRHAATDVAASTATRTAASGATRAATSGATRAAAAGGKGMLAGLGTAAASVGTAIKGAAMAVTAAIGMLPAIALAGVAAIGGVYLISKLFGSKAPESAASSGPVVPTRDYTADYQNGRGPSGHSNWADYVQNRGPAVSARDR